MPDDNRISVVLTDEQQQVATKVDEILALLPFLVNLTPEERRRTPTIATERAAMEETFDQQMAAHPELVPSYVNTDELAKDAALRSALLDMLARVNELRVALDDTLQVTGADKLTAYLAFYASVKEAARRGVAGADAVLSSLAQFFPRGRRRTPEST